MTDSPEMLSVSEHLRSVVRLREPDRSIVEDLRSSEHFRWLAVWTENEVARLQILDLDESLRSRNLCSDRKGMPRRHRDDKTRDLSVREVLQLLCEIDVMPVLVEVSE